jgi:hypothetical protein
MQGVIATKGVMHQPGALKRTVMLMVESKTIEPIGH